MFVVGVVCVFGFIGLVMFIVCGVDIFVSYIVVLLWFGEFLGCGIKVFMGMGVIWV